MGHQEPTKGLIAHNAARLDLLTFLAVLASRCALDSDSKEDLRGLLNFSALNAGGADTNALGCALDHCVYGLQIQIPAPLGDIVGVADTVSEPRAALTDFTHFRHIRSPAD
jgi:hypothetical protein